MVNVISHGTRSGNGETPPETVVRRSNAESSAAVHERFGSEFGPCFGEYGCSHSRIRGRLYATREAILFYSNVLGFEKRIFLYYQDITEMDLFRTTSICISTSEGETYVFKSFEDRKNVLRMLRSLEMNAATNSAVSMATPQRRPLDESVYISDANASDNNTDDIFGPPPPEEEHVRAFSPPIGAASPPSILKRTISSRSLQTPVLGNRRRAISDSVMSSAAFFSDSSHEDPLTSQPSPPPLPSSHVNKSDRQWDDMKSRGPLQNEAIESLILPCSLDTFFTTFLADDAPFSLEKYQREYIKDRDVEIGRWQVEDDQDRKTRKLTFSHPIKNSIGVGPSEARTSRLQTLECFANRGIVIENVTKIEGIPAADTFSVKDRWLIEQRENRDEVQLSSSFEIKFIRRSLLRGIIEKSVRKETGEWWAGYQSMLQAALASKMEPEKKELMSVNIAASDQVLEHLRNVYRLAVGLMCLVVAMLGVASLHAWVLQKELAGMRSELALVRQTWATKCTASILDEI